MGGVSDKNWNKNMYRETNLNKSYFLEMSTDDEEGDTVEPSAPLLSKPGFVAETP